MNNNRWAGKYLPSGRVVFYCARYSSISNIKASLGIQGINTQLWKFFRIPKYAYHPLADGDINAPK